MPAEPRAMARASEEQLIEHCQQVARVLPIIGFYLQPAVGGRVLPYRFWCEASSKLRT